MLSKLKMCVHPNIVRFGAAFEDREHFCLSLELANKASLKRSPKLFIVYRRGLAVCLLILLCIVLFRPIREAELSATRRVDAGPAKKQIEADLR